MVPVVESSAEHHAGLRKESSTALRFRSRLLCLPAAILIAFSSNGQQSAQPKPALPPLTAPAANLPFPAAETLTYQVDWRLLPAGTVTMHLEQQGQQERVSVAATTSGSVSVLYRVNDRFESIFDRATGCSVSLTKQAEEGRRRVNTDIRFDYANGRQTQTERNLVKNTAKQSSTPLPECATDILSALFYIAAQPLAVGQDFAFPLADAMRTVRVTAKAESREVIKVPLGSFPAIRVQPTADAGIVRNRGQIWIWYSEDARQVPVQIKAKLFWGTLTFRLASIENK